MIQYQTKPIPKLSWKKSGVLAILLALIRLFLFDSQAISNLFGKCDLDPRSHLGHLFTELNKNHDR
jgi:hypothetical protein